MEIHDLLELYARSAQSEALAKTLGDSGRRHVFVEGLVASAPAVLFASVAQRADAPLVFVMNDADSAGYLYHDLSQMLGQERVFFFPSTYRRQVKYGQRDAANEILRAEVLGKLGHGQKPYIVTYSEALAELVVSRRQLADHLLTLRVGELHDISQLEQQLREMGFHEVDYVYEPGQFATRGSIVDVFSFSSEYPLRIDFFGDEVDSIRLFNVQDQLSKERREQAEIVPELSRMQTEKVSFLSFLPDDAVLVTRDFGFVCDVVSRTYDEGFAQQALTERLEQAPEVERQAIMDEMRADSQLISGPRFAEEVLRFRRIELRQKTESARSSATIRVSTAPQPLFHKNFELLAQSLNDFLRQGYHLYILADSAKQHERLREIFSSEEIGGGTELPFVAVSSTLHEGFIDHRLKLCLFTDHQIFDRFHKYNLRSDAARTGKMALTMKELQELEVGDYLVHVDLGVGKFAGLVRVPLPPQQMPNGQTREGGYQEVIRIVYANNDKVDVSIHSLYKISKYKRRDAETPPRLSTLGTGAWDRLKERTKNRIKDIARDLIRLYAARRREKGFAFSPDSFMQHELEASFLYEDTPDQLKATNDVKADMEKARPMDRLVCGDVGFGKTEVAVRAAFKAACDSKQVAVMVPTTVLAYQHYQTFSSRLKDMPVRVDYLSRARSAKKTKEILADLAEGKIDIIIGTHKLIGKSVKFRDLGLLIIDEEQKFGVATKERLRKVKVSVDTLTMSATPIPRTLQFSLMGARDMSIIQTPPPNRYPIQTEIISLGKTQGEATGWQLIGDAINFEMSRNGQVFFVNDRVSNLTELSMIIRKYVPDARIAIGHGQMKPEELEKIIMGFINYDYDVLLSTTIVENGVDIPNANTIIINDAHRFGLSDLHQMRGRVGRSNKKAFCYLVSPPLSVINQEARKRLEALETFSELGSGFNLSMQDLDIRGAGNLLGAEQSGFMEDLGYETYQKILSQAVTELKNDEFGELFANGNEERGARSEERENRASADSGTNPRAKDYPRSPLPAPRSSNPDSDLQAMIDETDFVDDCAVESDLEMYLPELYVPSSSERILLYRQLDSIGNETALEQYRNMLRDRFGPIPPEGEELLHVVPLRWAAKRLGCEKVMLKQGQMTLYFVQNPNSAYYQSRAFERVINYAAAQPRRCALRELRGKRSMVVKQVPTVAQAVAVLREIG